MPRKPNSCLEKLLALKADWEDAAFRLGFLQLQRGEYAGAVDSFEICLKKRKDWVEALLNLGLAFWKFEDLDGAAQTFNRVLALQPQQYGRVARADGHRHRTQESEAGVGAASEGDGVGRTLAGAVLQPGAPAAIHRRRGRGGGMLPDGGRSTKPDFPQALLNLGHALKATGKEERSAAGLEPGYYGRPGAGGEVLQLNLIFVLLFRGGGDIGSRFAHPPQLPVIN